jgi:hypothetical protein
MCNEPTCLAPSDEPDPSGHKKGRRLVRKDTDLPACLPCRARHGTGRRACAERTRRRGSTPPPPPNSALILSARAERREAGGDTWQRRGLAGGEFGAIIGISKHTLYQWKTRFDEHGPAGLMEMRRGAGKGSRRRTAGTCIDKQSTGG